MNYDGTAIILMDKEHYESENLVRGKLKRRKIEIPIEKFFDDTIYNLLTRGYKLKDWR